MRQMFCSVHVVFTQWENLKWLPQATTVVMLRWLEADHRRWAWKVWWSLNVVKGRRWRSFTSQNGLVKAQFCFYCHIKLRSLGKVTLGLCYRILEYQSIVLSGWIKTEQKSKNEMLWIHIKVIRKMQLDATERTELFFLLCPRRTGPRCCVDSPAYQYPAQLGGKKSCQLVLSVKKLRLRLDCWTYQRHELK